MDKFKIKEKGASLDISNVDTKDVKAALEAIIEALEANPNALEDGGVIGIEKIDDGTVLDVAHRS